MKKLSVKKAGFAGLFQTNTGERIFNKMLQILPYQILGSMSTVILLLVDGLVVGNFLGENALGSVNLISPVATFTGALCGVVGSGISISLSQAMVSVDKDAVKKVYKASIYLAIVTMLVIAILEIPAAKLIIDSYNLDEEELSLVWSYSSGTMISFVIAVISTIGAFILVSVGAAKKLAFLAILESAVNIFFDLLFVGVCNMGVAGAGYGTAIACTVRAIATIVFILKSVKLFPLIKGPCLSDMITIARTGTYRLYSDTMLFLKNYFITLIILKAVGKEGFAAYSVMCFAITIVNSLDTSVTQAVGPFNGMLTGIGEWEGGTRLLKKTLGITFLIAAAISIILIAFPGSVFMIYSIRDASILQLTIVRIMAFMLVPLALNKIIQNYMTYCHMKSIASVASAFQFVIILLPLAVGLGHFTNMGAFISFVISNTLVFIATAVVYRIRIKEIAENEKCIKYLDLTIKKSQAADFSREIEDFFMEIYGDKSLANKLSVCAEEASAYLKSARKKEATSDILYRAFKDRVVLFVLNSEIGESFLDELIDDENVPILNNYFIMRKLSDKYSYHNICGLNSYTMIFNVC